MRKSHVRKDSLVIAFAILTGAAISFAVAATTVNDTTIGREVAIPVHLEDGQEFKLSIPDLIAFGRKLFLAGGQSKKAKADLCLRVPGRHSQIRVLP